MIRNIVLFRLHNGVVRESLEVAKGVELISALPAQISELRELELGWHVLGSTPIHYDFALSGLFEDSAAFFRYFHHPAHQAAMGHWREIASWGVIDIEV
ncbi:Dabb family protein [Streptomyces bauhiniae]